jgi:radical SAM superfamily enzyme YgiQ (UPF0313 family)
MTFQRGTALNIAKFVRRLRPGVSVVVGGYDPSLAPEAYEACPDVDFIVRGEGEQTFCELLRAAENGAGYHDVPGLSYRHRTVSGAILTGRSPGSPPTLFGFPIAPLACSAGTRCSAAPWTSSKRRGDARSIAASARLSRCVGAIFHAYPLERVMADVSDARSRGTRTIFLVDDNITLDIRRFESLCRAIIEGGFNDIDYVVQAMTSPLAEHGATLAPLMRRAGFRYVFLGIENVLDEDLAFLKARAKNVRRANGRQVGNATIEAIEHLHRHGLFVVGGMIVGNPDDTRESIDKNLEFASRYIDWPYIQHPTPYPRTPMTEEFRRRSLIRRRGCRALRRHHCRGALRARLGVRYRVLALAQGTVDQAPSFPCRLPP